MVTGRPPIKGVRPVVFVTVRDVDLLPLQDAWCKGPWPPRLRVGQNSPASVRSTHRMDPHKEAMNQQRFVQGAFLLFALGVMAVQAIAG
jgi:hypothetical protein